MHPSEWYNSAQAAVGLDPAMRGSSGVANRTEPLFKQGMSFEAMSATTGIPLDQIRAYAAQAHPTYGVAAPAPTGGGGTDTSGLTFNGSGSGSGAQAAQDAADRVALRNEIAGKSGAVDATYNDLFGSLDNLLKSRDSSLETQYGTQFKKAGDQYAEAIPQIETSYAAIGAGDSTDNTYAKNTAKKGFEDTTATIGTNKTADKAKLGQYGSEQRAKIATDKGAADRAIAQAGSTTDVSALRSMRNDLNTSLGAANVTKATLGSDGQAQQDLSALTGDSGRFEAATNALDGILKSSLSGSVKDAAVQAVTNSAGLSDAEKKKVQATYGNTYAEQAAL